MSKLGEISASSTETITLQFLPQYLHFVASTVPTQLKINISGDGVLADLDGGALDDFRGMNGLGQKTNLYRIQLADGIIKDKTVKITIANAIAGALEVFGFSKENGSVYFKYTTISALANQPVVIKDFAYLAMPDFGASDEAQILFQDGTQDKFEQEDIEAMLMDHQNDISGVYSLDNFDQEVKRVTAYVGSAQDMWKMAFRPVGALDDASGGAE